MGGYGEYYVVVKMTDYQFMPSSNDESIYDGGNYHSEGLDEDHIAAVGLHYFDISDNILGGGLDFKQNGREKHVVVKDNSCVLFSNTQSIVHKADEMSMIYTDDAENG